MYPDAWTTSGKFLFAYTLMNSWTLSISGVRKGPGRDQEGARKGPGRGQDVVVARPLLPSSSPTSDPFLTDDVGHVWSYTSINIGQERSEGAAGPMARQAAQLLAKGGLVHCSHRSPSEGPGVFTETSGERKVVRWHMHAESTVEIIPSTGLMHPFLSFMLRIFYQRIHC